MRLIAVALVGACGTAPETTVDARPSGDARVVDCGGALPRPGVGCVVLGGPLRAPRDVWVTTDGVIVVSEFGAGRIVGLEGAAWVPIATGLNGPIGLREAGGRLVVGEENAHSVAFIDPLTGARELIAGGLHQVTYVATAGGLLYVSSFETTSPVGSGIVYQVEPTTGTATPFATGTHVPEGLFVDDDGALMVAEWQLPSAILRYPAAGGTITEAEVVASDFEHVYGLASDGDGGLFVGDHAGRVVHVHGDGTRDVLLGGIGRPGGITRHPDGDLLVVEFVDFGAEGRIFRLSGVP